jgi:hypothetical protein
MSAAAGATATASPYTFKKPVQSRSTDASGVARPVYTFAVETGEGLSGLYEAMPFAPPFLNTLLKESPQWLETFINSFLQSTKTYFAKPYSSAMILKHITHRVVFDNSCSEGEGAVMRTYTPTAIVIVQGRFTLEWKVSQETIAIQIPDEDEEEEEEVMLTATQKSLLGLTTPAPLFSSPPASATAAPPRVVNEVVAVVDVPFTSNTEVLDLRTNEHQAFYKRKVKEANLRAKLAQYKAERALAKYMDKYGDTLSDSSDGSGWETSDADSGSDSDA